MSVGPERNPLAEELCAAHARFLMALPMAWASRRVELLREGQQHGWLFSFLVVSRSGNPAWVLADRPSDRGLRVHALQLSKSSPSALAEAVDSLDRSDRGPLYAISDLIEGVDPEEQERLFAARGFSARAPVQMELPKDWPLPRAPEDFPLRVFAPTDRQEFIELYARVYDEPQGDWSLYPAPDVEADARLFIDHFVTSEGAYAPSMVAAGSLVHEGPDRMLGCILVERWSAEDLSVADLMVDPSSRRQGMGRALLLHSLHRVRGEAKGRVLLGVVRGTPAQRLYESVGFVEVAPPGGLLPSYWVRVRSP